MIHCTSHRLEETIEIYFNPESIQFEKQPTSNKSIKIKGRFDRFDLINDNSFVLFDYKSAKSAGTHMAKSWLKYNEYQLLIYSLCIEQAYGYKSLGALYYFYKNYEHHVGYILEQDFEYKKSLSLKKNSVITEVDLLNVKTDFLNELKNLFERLELSNFKTSPVDEKECQTCDWRKLCRAPHLN